jgi:hypothetical protein
MTLPAFIDPSWSMPLNTVLLILLAIVNVWRARVTRRRLTLLSQQTIDAKNKVGANRRAEDVELIDTVKQEMQTEPPAPHIRPRRFTDRGK